MKSINALAAILAAAAMASFPSRAETRASAWTISANPAVSVPLASGDFSGPAGIGPSWGGDLAATRALGSTPLSLRLGAGYGVAGLAELDGIASGERLDEARLAAGLGWGTALTGRLSLDAYLEGGMAYGRLSSGAGSAYPAARAGAGLSFRLGGAWSLGLGATATYMSGLYAAAGGSLGLSYRLPERSRQSIAPQPAKLRLLRLDSIEVDELFPVFRSRYDQSPVGRIALSNAGSKTANRVRVSFFLRQYMDTPKECAVIEAIAPGQTVEVALYGLFNDGILNVTEATKASAEIAVSYESEGLEGEESRAATVLVYDRNALTWSDDRHAAAFVSSKDPWVLDLTGNVLAAVKASRNAELPKNLQTAIAFHEGLRAYGLSYVLSPNRPFAAEGGDRAAVDTLKFPRQTLAFRAGDCADLSVLYASCFEAAGLETAFVTVPGHIFMAVDLGLTAEEAAAWGLPTEDLLVREGRAWLPIETTMRDSGLLDTCRKAASQWREASSRGQAAILPLREAWKAFAPVGLPADGSAVVPPPADKVAAAFAKELAAAVDLALGARLKALGPVGGQGANAAKSLNERGVLYAKYGRHDDALRDFQAAAKAGNPAGLVNQGNIAMIRADYETALRHYRAAAQKLSGNAGLQLNIARAARAAGKAAEAEAALAKAAELDPGAARGATASIQTAQGGARAAEVGEDSPVWL